MECSTTTAMHNLEIPQLSMYNFPKFLIQVVLRSPKFGLTYATALTSTQKLMYKDKTSGYLRSCSRSGKENPN